MLKIRAPLKMLIGRTPEDLRLMSRVLPRADTDTSAHAPVAYPSISYPYALTSKSFEHLRDAMKKENWNV